MTDLSLNVKFVHHFLLWRFCSFETGRQSRPAMKILDSSEKGRTFRRLPIRPNNCALRLSGLKPVTETIIAESTTRL
jgi:hypothetical protein